MALRHILLSILIPLISAQTPIPTQSKISADLNATSITTVDGNVTLTDGTSKKSPYPEVIDCDVHRGLIANPFVESSCDRHFYSCDNFIGIKIECSHGLFFDHHTQTCQPWHDVHACSGFTHTTTLPHSTASHAATVTFDHTKFSCIHKANGNYADITARKPRCSQRYLTCDNGKLILQWCLRGYYFDEGNDRCDLHDNVYDCTGRTKPPTTTLSSSNQTTIVVDFDCTNKTNGLYPNPLKKCDRKFYSCSEGIAREDECPSYLVYDPEKEKCRRRADTFDCTLIRRSTTLAPTTRTPRTPTNFTCTGLPDGSLHSDPDNPCADYFIQCWADQAVLMDCPPSLFFNNETSQCDYKWNVESCRGSKKFIRPTWTKTPELTRSTPPVSGTTLIGTKSNTDSSGSIASVSENPQIRPWGMRGKHRPDEAKRNDFADPRIVF